MRRRSVAASVFLAAALTALSAALPSCKRPADDGVAAVDTELLAYLSAARALHHEANLKEDASDLPGAADALTRLVALPRPHPERRTPEIEEVLADTYARLAELRLKKGDLDLAAEAVTAGHAHAAGVTYFKGHLVEVEGLVEEARAARFADAGDPAEAERARARAIALLEEVVKIQDEVIRASLAKDAGPPPSAAGTNSDPRSRR